MKVLLDSNVLLVILPKQSKYRIIFDLFLQNKLTFIVSNEVLLEYEEVITRFTNNQIATNVVELLLVKSNVVKYDTYFNWELIKIDNDDNKFVDLALAANAEYLVTNDKHFEILKSIDFPKVNVISLDNFIELIKTLNIDCKKQ